VSLWRLPEYVVFYYCVFTGLLGNPSLPPFLPPSGGNYNPQCPHPGGNENPLPPSLTAGTKGVHLVEYTLVLRQVVLHGGVGKEVLTAAVPAALRGLQLPRHL
jgi:hypothetical protein